MSKVLSPWIVSLFGLSSMFICYLFIGPAPYLPLFSPTIYSVCASLVANGFGSSAVLIASFACAQSAASESGQDLLG